MKITAASSLGKSLRGMMLVLGMMRPLFPGNRDDTSNKIIVYDVKALVSESLLNRADHRLFSHPFFLN